ncbi:MAG: aspartyl protease family protein [Actinomycetota bacterium]
MAAKLERYLGGHRPGQADGAVVGVSAATGQPLKKKVEWMVDTGSDPCLLPEAVAKEFKLQPPKSGGIVAYGLGGMTALVRKGGIRMAFFVTDGAGNETLVKKDVDFYIAPPGYPHCVIGMHALAQAGAEFRWSPSAGSGALTVPWTQ